MAIDHDVLIGDLSKNIELTDEEMAVRALFVHEYLKDFHPEKAAIRCGFIGIIARDYAHEFLSEPFVQRLLSEAQLRLPKDSEQGPNINDVDVAKQQVKLHLHEIASGNVRATSQQVTALIHLSKMYYMDADYKPKETPSDTGLPTSGVMEVPGLLSLEQWESASIQSQTKLKDNVRD